MSDSILLLTNETPIEFIENLFFQGKTGKKLKNLHFEGKLVQVDPSFVNFDDVLVSLRRKRKLENAKRSYEKNKESRLERERIRYHKMKAIVGGSDKPVGRPRMVFKVPNH